METSAKGSSQTAQRSGSEQHKVSLQAKHLGRLSPLRSAVELLSTWLQIAAIIGAYAMLQTWWAFVAAFVLVGTRQYGLLILLHDAFHTLLHPRRSINDMVGLWLIAAPCGLSYFNSRCLHLLHRQNFGKGEKDPDFFFYCSGPPFRKDAHSAFFGHFLKLLHGKQVFHTLFNAGASKPNPAPRDWRAMFVSLVPVGAMQLVLLATFTVLDMLVLASTGKTSNMIFQKPGVANG